MLRWGVNLMTEHLRLKEYREKRNLSLRDLARELDVNFSTLSYWESGTKVPKAKNKMKLEVQPMSKH